MHAFLHLDTKDLTLTLKHSCTAQLYSSTYIMQSPISSQTYLQSILNCLNHLFSLQITLLFSFSPSLMLYFFFFIRAISKALTAGRTMLGTGGRRSPTVCFQKEDFSSLLPVWEHGVWGCLWRAADLIILAQKQCSAVCRGVTGREAEEVVLSVCVLKCNTH